MAVTQELVNSAAAALGVTVEDEVGEGGQKTVFRATTEEGVVVVLKVMAIGASLPDALKRARREVELLQTVDHPNVVKVASDLTELGDPLEGAAWLEEFIEGDDLSDLMGDEWSWNDTKAMAIDVASGLEALHDAQVVHRDLSANNVRRRAGGGYVVMDPGWARHLKRSKMTIGGQPGTPGFLSPEHLNGYSGAPTASSDVFCVGILMFLALTAKLPIPWTGDLGDYVSRLSRLDVDDLSAMRADLNPDQIGLVKRCLHPQPARRSEMAASFALPSGTQHDLAHRGHCA